MNVSSFVKQTGEQMSVTNPYIAAYQQKNECLQKEDRYEEINQPSEGYKRPVEQEVNRSVIGGQQALAVISPSCLLQPASCWPLTLMDSSY